MVCSFTILELSLFTNWFALLGPFEMGRWSPGITCQDVSKRHIIHGRVLAVIASIFVAKTIWFGAATASVIWSVHPTKVNQENHTNHVDSMEQQLDDVGHASIFQVDMELRIRQFQRRRLIRILNQFTNMRKNQRVIRELANQGPDGSHLVNQSISPVEVETTGPHLSLHNCSYLKRAFADCDICDGFSLQKRQLPEVDRNLLLCDEVP